MTKDKPKKAPAKTTKSDLISSQEYETTLADLKKSIQESQLKAATAVNKELIRLYWTIGKTIVERQEKSGWGTKLIDKLTKDIQNAFPGMDGFSRTNVFRMRAFYLAYSNCLTAVGQLEPFLSIPWGHNFILLDKLKSFEERLWYAQKTIEHGWSRSLLTVWIENNLHKREGKAITNFKDTLPSPQSDLAQQMTRDPYWFQLVGLEKDFKERELEKSLIDHVQHLLSEFGRGFAFVGRQCPLEVDGKEFYVDLLFYHVTLHCYVVVELKTEEFQPEFAGKMNFYLGAVDRILKKDNDSPSIGLILCKSKSKIQVEIALQDIKKPIGVANYIVDLEKSLPKEFLSSLPTIEEIEAEFSNEP